MTCKYANIFCNRFDTEYAYGVQDVDKESSKIKICIHNVVSWLILTFFGHILTYPDLSWLFLKTWFSSWSILTVSTLFDIYYNILTFFDKILTFLMKCQFQSQYFSTFSNAGGDWKTEYFSTNYFTHLNLNSFWWCLCLWWKGYD